MLTSLVPRSLGIALFAAGAMLCEASVANANQGRSRSLDTYSDGSANSSRKAFIPLHVAYNNPREPSDSFIALVHEAIRDEQLARINDSGCVSPYCRLTGEILEETVSLSVACPRLGMGTNTSLQCVALLPELADRARIDSSDPQLRLPDFKPVAFSRHGVAPRSYLIPQCNPDTLHRCHTPIATGLSR